MASIVGLTCDSWAAVGNLLWELTLSSQSGLNGGVRSLEGIN